MVFTNEYSKPILKSFVLTGSSSRYDFYDEVEIKLCGVNSGFGRNLDAFRDVLIGGFGDLNFIKSDVTINIYIKNSKLLDNKIIEILNDSIEENKRNNKNIFIYLE